MKKNLSKSKLLILLVVAFCINMLQLILFFFTAYGPLVFKEGIFSAVIFTSPEFSHLSLTTLTFINITTSIIYFGGLTLGLVIPLLYKISLVKRNLFTWTATILPVLLIIIKLAVFPTPYTYLKSSSNGYTYQKYIWKRQDGYYVKLWRSEKCDTCYQPQERIKWILIKQGYEK